MSDEPDEISFDEMLRMVGRGEICSCGEPCPFYPKVATLTAERDRAQSALVVEQKMATDAGAQEFRAMRELAEVKAERDALKVRLARAEGRLGRATAIVVKLRSWNGLVEIFQLDSSSVSTNVHAAPAKARVAFVFCWLGTALGAAESGGLERAPGDGLIVFFVVTTRSHDAKDGLGVAARIEILRDDPQAALGVRVSGDVADPIACGSFGSCTGWPCV